MGFRQPTAGLPALSRSFVLGSSSPRIGLLLRFRAKAQRRIGPGPSSSRSLLVRAESLSIEIWSARAIGFNRVFSSSRLWFFPPTHPATSQVRVALGFASSVAKSEAFAGWCWCVWASGVGSTSTPRPRGQCLVQPFHPHPRLFQLGVYWRQLLVSGPESQGLPQSSATNY